MKVPALCLPFAPRRKSAILVTATALFVAALRSLPCAEAQSTPVPSTQGTNFHTIGLEEFRQALASGSGIIVDARLEEEYNAGHVPGAVNLPRYKVVIQPSEVGGKLSKERALVLYCGSSECQDADLEAQALIKLGYAHVSVFEGGMKEWRKHKLPEEQVGLPLGTHP